MLEELKYQVCGANLELVARGVVIYTWGNVSGIDRDKGLVVIKPSGVVYDNMMLSRLVDTFFSRTSWTMLLYAENHSISVA